MCFLGDVWFFPAGVPHSIQALDEGSEFLLVFDSGTFSEDATFLASELFLRNPKEVLSKNLQTPVSAFDKLPTGELYVSSFSWLFVCIVLILSDLQWYTCSGKHFRTERNIAIWPASHQRVLHIPFLTASTIRGSRWFCQDS